MSTASVSWCISSFGRLPYHTADAAAAFLKSPDGVYAALHLATDEMATIKEDRWDDAIWGAPADECDDRAPDVVPLRFYFGRNDVWVWSEARDRLIAERGRSIDETTDSWKPVMVVDNGHIPHGFIVAHSEVVAQKASDMITKLFSQDRMKSLRLDH